MPLPVRSDPGGPADLDYWEQVVQPLLGSDVEIVGELPDAEKEALLRNAAALVFPIRWPEPFGLVMIEALACGTPVVALRNGSVPEVIDDGLTGWIVSALPCASPPKRGPPPSGGRLPSGVSPPGPLPSSPLAPHPAPCHAPTATPKARSTLHVR